VEFFYTHVSARAVELAAEVLRSGWLSEGTVVKQFEAALTDRLGLVRPVAVNSGTAALHLALAVAGIGPGDEVIIPAQTFVASGLVVLMQGAVPVFADVDPATGNMTASAVEAKLTARTRAVMPVHWGGYPCDMDKIVALADARDLVVVEDAAHALGATYRGRPIGAISRFTAFSFQAIKHVTTGDGGALSCLREDDAREAQARRWFGIDRANSRPSELGEREYDIAAVGYKYHLNNLGAAVGLGNLEDFAGRLARRRAIAARYRAGLADVPELDLLAYRDDRESAYWLFTLLVDRRLDFIRKLGGQSIPASVVHLRIDRNSVFGGLRADLPGQETFDRRQVAIPVHEGLSDDDVDRIVEVIRSGW
jgi:perosamine synthetase